jgi:transcriptional regulator with XRE-family HTH domain
MPQGGTALKLARVGKGMSQDALAAAASISQSEISRIERGWRRPSQATVHRIARALQVSPTLLFDHDNVGR